MDDIILAAYDVAVGSAQWRQLSAMLAEALDSRNLLIFLFDDRSGAIDLLARIGEENQDRIEACLAIAQTMAMRSGDTSRSGEPRRYRRLAARAAGARVARWNSLSVVSDWYLAGMAIANAGEGLWFCVGVDIAEPMVAEEVREKVERMLPHFCRAAEIDRNLRVAARRSSFSDAVCDRLPFGLVQFDHNATVLHSNAEAERISRMREGFVIVSGKARAGSPADDATLQNAIRESIATRQGPFARWLSIKRDKRRRPYRILVTALPDARGTEGNASGCALFIIDPERPSMVDPGAIADAFGLTTAEARVVARLAMGISLPDIAANLKVSINTVRTLLARAMGKTTTNTQVALVRMVLTTFSLSG